jgi:tetrahydromethanopterin S-methyltransferase subunit G
VPDFYRMMFERNGEMQYDLQQLGIGLGITNGVVWGLVTGLIIVLAVTFFQSRRAKLKSE